MIGYFDYTVVLTYLSLLSATTGIIVSLSGSGHPYLGMFFLLFCGLCDAFDGKVARTKKSRTEMEKNFGIQIDSLSDLVAFGVLPACIGAAMIRISPTLFPICSNNFGNWYCIVIRFTAYAILVLYVLAALIRLAYFNVTEEERQKKEKNKVRKSYTGLPVTSSSLIFPAVMLLQFIIPIDITIVYFIVVIITGVSFLLKFEIKKPELKGILLMILVGAIEFILLIILKIHLHH
ncbi:MAG: CDP-alcohol phosphatidyltransferase family protein [Erysipelotrichales bacterium]|nr:CDP-alcohol phosphatidyltransferase family protein [Erysipelotrichales bacterium]